ncbi:hypothetical protein J3F83DRAFT_721138 [Trichoderma novae-zelandiae]
MRREADPVRLGSRFPYLVIIIMCNASCIHTLHVKERAKLAMSHVRSDRERGGLFPEWLDSAVFFILFCGWRDEAPGVTVRGRQLITLLYFVCVVWLYTQILHVGTRNAWMRGNEEVSVIH